MSALANAFALLLLVVFIGGVVFAWIDAGEQS
jgi:hypothetical protein